MTKKKHDNFFRTVFSKPERARKLLELASKRNERLRKLLSLLNLATLQEISGAAPREDLGGNADVAFRVNLAGDKGVANLFIGLLMEHKSYKPQKCATEESCSEGSADGKESGLTLREQLLKYYMEVMYQKVGNIPVVAIVVYSGAGIWKQLDEKPYPDKYPEYFQNVGLPFNVEFINIGDEVTAEDFDSLDPLMKLVLVAMRYAFDTMGMGKLFSKVLAEFVKTYKKGDRSVVEEILVYLRNVLQPEQKEILMDTLYERMNKGYKSIADVDWEEGHNAGLEEGLERGREEGLEKGLEKGHKEGVGNAVAVMMSLKLGKTAQNVSKELGIPLEIVLQIKRLMNG